MTNLHCMFLCQVGKALSRNYHLGLVIKEVVILCPRSLNRTIEAFPQNPNPTDSLSFSGTRTKQEWWASCLNCFLFHYLGVRVSVEVTLHFG